MVTVCGIDWAVDPKKRAAVVLRADGEQGIAFEEIICPISDAVAGALCVRPQFAAAGVDTPFGWPAAFADLAGVWAPAEGTDVRVPSGTDFSYRLTDRVVWEEVRKPPLSVSSDRIALAARAWLQVVIPHRLAPQFDVGAGGERPNGRPVIIEVYPAATLLSLYPKSGELRTDGYKRDPIIRQHILAGLIHDLQLRCSPEQQAQLVSQGEDSDKLDALLAAVTCLFYLDAVPGWSVRRPLEHEIRHAKREGWIFFPQRLTA